MGVAVDLKPIAGTLAPRQDETKGPIQGIMCARTHARFARGKLKHNTDVVYYGAPLLTFPQKYLSVTRT